METNQNYYRRRAAEEQMAARTATDLRVRDTHLELARRYSEIADADVAAVVAEEASLQGWPANVTYIR